MTVRVPVKPHLLDWALDRIANPEDVFESIPQLSKWLAGDLLPTMNQLTQFASKTKTPFGYLLLDEPPSIKLPIKDFRDGFNRRGVSGPSPDLLAVVNQSIRRQDWYRDYALDNGADSLGFVGIAQNMQPDEAATQMRATLNFEIDDRRGSWSDQRRHLLQAFEESGGLTVATSMVENNNRRMLDPDEFRGFSLVDPIAPLVFVNTAQTMNGQIFTLAHEFAHIWKGIGGVSLESIQDTPQSSIEKWCNRVASEFLVPAIDLRSRVEQLADKNLEEKLDALAKVYRCGTLVILMALNRIGILESKDFDAVYSREVERLKELAGKNKGKPGGTYWANQPHRIGRRLSRALVNDAAEGRTGFSEIISLSSLKSASNFDKYANQVKEWS